jgi:tRNA A37 methylthiotransferase MiaB
MRPDTLAKNMEQIDSRVIKERSIRLSRVFRMLIENINEKWVGWKGKVLLLHRTKKSGQTFGRNYAYKNIFLNSENLQVGSFVKVEITKVDGYNLYAKSI